MQTPEYRSKTGNYFLPITVANGAIVVPKADTNLVPAGLKMVEEDSQAGKWTYVAFTPYPLNYPRSGSDSYLMSAGHDLSLIGISWAPKGDPNTNAIGTLPGTILDSAPAEITVDGKRALMTRSEDKGRCYAVVEVDRGETHYEIWFIGPDFKGPNDDAFMRVMKSIRFADLPKVPVEAPQLGVTAPGSAPAPQSFSLLSSRATEAASSDQSANKISTQDLNYLDLAQKLLRTDAK